MPSHLVPCTVSVSFGTGVTVSVMCATHRALVRRWTCVVHRYDRNTTVRMHATPSAFQGPLHVCHAVARASVNMSWLSEISLENCTYAVVTMVLIILKGSLRHMQHVCVE